MNSRAFSIATRAMRPMPRALPRRTPVQRRYASSDPERFNITQFYKIFTRPVAKVLLMAVFIYQLAYWGWTKLELDETMATREAYIAELEHEIYKLTGKPVGSAAAKHKIIEAARHHADHDLQQYKTQLLELEERKKVVLEAARQAQVESAGLAEGKPAAEAKNASPWWKVW